MISRKQAVDTYNELKNNKNVRYAAGAAALGAAGYYLGHKFYNDNNHTAPNDRPQSAAINIINTTSVHNKSETNIDSQPQSATDTMYNKPETNVDSQPQSATDTVHNKSETNVDSQPQSATDAVHRVLNKNQNNNSTDSYQPSTGSKVTVDWDNPAIRKYEQMYGHKPDLITAKILQYEGYTDKVYHDRHQMSTGFGMNTEYVKKGMTVDDVIKEKMNIISHKINNFNELPDNVKSELVASAYRGGITGSPKTIALINKGDYEAAAKEFLNNKEYEDPNTPVGVKRRMENLANAILSLAHQKGDTQYASKGSRNPV